MSLLTIFTGSDAQDPLTTLDLVEDFASGTATTAQIGVLGWLFVGGTIAFRVAEASHPGIIRRDTSAVASTFTLMNIRTSTELLLASEFFDLTWVFRINQTDADTRVRLGLSSDFASNTASHGIYLEKTLTDTDWFGVGRASGTETRTASMGVVDTNWHKIRIRRTNATTVGFTLDAGSEVLVASNVPTAAIQAGNHIFNNTAVSKTMDLDYFRLKIAGLVR